MYSTFQLQSSEDMMIWGAVANAYQASQAMGLKRIQLAYALRNSGKSAYRSARAPMGPLMSIFLGSM